MRDPVNAIRHISRDPSLKWVVERASGSGGGTIGAVAIQRVFLAAAQERLRGLSEDTDWVLTEWEQILDRLETDPLGCADTLDWAAKRALIEEFREDEGLPWSDPTLQSIDLEYHNVDPDAGLYYGLEQEGRVRRLLTNAEIENALIDPPAGSPRAIVRGLAVARFPQAVRGVSWSAITLADPSGQTVTIPFSQVQDLDPGQVRAALADTKTPTAFVAALQAMTRDGFV